MAFMDRYTHSIFVNDTIYDGQDRWRTGSYQISSYGISQSHVLDELRLRFEIISPENIPDNNFENDRPYATIAEIGYHRYFHLAEHRLSAGVKMAMIGERNLIGDFQNNFHDLLGLNKISVGEYHIPDQTRLGAELGWQYQKPTEFGQFVTFSEIELGMRNRITFGMDAIIGKSHSVLLSREQTTGQLLQNFSSTQTKDMVQFVVGGDLSYVWHDEFIDNAVSNVTREPIRFRLRLGTHWQHNNFTVFLGPTYLSPEFKEQKSGQIVQALSIEYNF